MKSVKILWLVKKFGFIGNLSGRNVKFFEVKKKFVVYLKVIVFFILFIICILR